MTQHTETRWKSHCLGSEGYSIYPVHSKTLSELKAESKSQDEFYDKVHPIARLEGSFERQKANAKFIETACNNYDTFVDFLKWLDNFEMKFYCRAEDPTYEKMKSLYIELGDKIKEIQALVNTDKED